MKLMSLERFRDLLDHHGSDLARWPSVDGAEAAVLVQVDAEARAMLDGARRLDRAWTETRPPDASRDLHARILRALPAREVLPASPRSMWAALLGEIGGWRIAGPALAAAMALGIALGYGMGDETSFDLVDLAGFSDIDIEY
jgi:anti-sigma-K factor RskA